MTSSTTRPKVNRRKVRARERFRGVPGAAYALDVCAGTVVAGRLLHLACERHLRDLERHGVARGGNLWFDVRAAVRAISFIEGFCRHFKGVWAGKLLKLAPWQVFLVASLFGWRRADGTRRFRRAYVQVAKKNGKSTLMAAIGLYMLIADREPGAEVCSVATTRGQAREVWGAAAKMVKKDASLRRKVKPFRVALTYEGGDASFRPITASADAEDGASPSCIIADELHRWPNRDLFDLLENASAARSQPLFLAITTAGSGRSGVCWEEREYAEQVLDGVLVNEAHFALIFEPDEGDAWDAEVTWQKANPSLGASVDLREFRETAERARGKTSLRLAFERYRCNRWTDAAMGWITAEEWRACGGGPRLDDWPAGWRVVPGLDLSKSRDWSAAAVVAMPEEGSELYRVAFKIWLPGEDIVERERYLRVPLREWAEAGWIELTEGTRTDQDVVGDWFRELSERHHIERVAYDPTGAWKLSVELERFGITMAEILQRMDRLGPATIETEELIVTGRLQHDDNPAIAWMMSNVELEQDRDLNKRPSRRKSRSKIDAIVALIMAAYEAIKIATAGEGESIYEREGLIAS